jgi:3-methyladenine DNA glycosylase AlkD
VPTATEAEQIFETLRELGTAQRAAAERAYLKSPLRHLGVPVPGVRKVVRTWVHQHPVITADDVFRLADDLWSRPVHESRLAAIELLAAVPGAVTAVRMPWLEARLRECGTWALVDPLAGTVVADVAFRDPASVLPVLDRWVVDDDFWVRRGAVLSLRSLLRHGDQLDRLFTYAERLLPESEFFIRKVLGWVLREAAPRHPREVSTWLRRNMSEMNLVTLREPLRKLPDAAELRALYDTRRNSPG